MGITRMKKYIYMHFYKAWKCCRFQELSIEVKDVALLIIQLKTTTILAQLTDLWICMSVSLTSLPVEYQQRISYLGKTILYAQNKSAGLRTSTACYQEIKDYKNTIILCKFGML